MHKADWKNECRNLALLLAVAALLGWFIGAVAWALFVASGGYIAWNLYQLQRIQAWLSQHSEVDPPESQGLWGDVLDGIYRLQRRGKEERVKLQAAVDYLRDSFASLEDAAVMLDREGLIEWSNIAAEKLLGLRYPQDTRQQLVNLIRSPEFIEYFEGDDYHSALMMVSPQLPDLQLQINITYFGQGSRLLFARDISQTYRLQQMRKEFVANVSHELRTPLTVINGYLETLNDSDKVDELPWRRAISQMLTQSHRMEALIKDLIALSRLESVAKSSEQIAVEISPMLALIRSEALTTVKPTLTINIDCDDSIQLLGNPDELRSAFTNLVINAAKYTQDGGVIDIRWYADQQHAYLEVEDNGEGIDGSHLVRITERFYRVDKSRSVETGGTGLGLAIVKHILLRHQAELKISSEPDVGSIFCCVFPVNRVVEVSEPVITPP